MASLIGQYERRRSGEWKRDATEVAALRALTKARLTTVGAVFAASERLPRVRGLGRKTIQRIALALAECGVRI
jgi:hypothetical protein